MFGKLALGGAALILGAAACSGGSDRDRAGGPPPATTLAEASPDAAAWPTAGRDLANSRAVPQARLTSDTIGQADNLWRTSLPDAGALSTAPLVVDGTVYLQGASGQVVALDLASGEVRWSSEATGFNIGPFGVAGDGDRGYGSAG